MKKGLTEIAMVVDRSGSMASLVGDTIGGFNKFIEDQIALPGSANVTLAMFSDRVSIAHKSIGIDKITFLSRANYRPAGNTALYDAVCETIIDVGQRLSERPESERAEKVVVVIITDGEENHSVTYDHAQTATMIKHQQEVYNWEFLFLGANIDAPAVAAAMNIPVANASNFMPSAAGVQDLYANVNSRMTRLRTSK